MTKKRKNPAAVALGRIGGKGLSPAKRRAVLENLKAAWAARRKKGGAK